MEYQPEAVAESATAAFNEVNGRGLYRARLLKISSQWHWEDGEATIRVGPSMSSHFGEPNFAWFYLNLEMDLGYIL